MTDVAGAAAEFAELARNLSLVGFTDLRRELDKAVGDAAKPIADEIGNAGHLRDDLPDPYADVLSSDLRVSITKRTTGEGAGVSVVAQSRTRARKLRRLDAGALTHPLYGNRRHWFTQAVTPGFFTGPAERAAPAVREQILQAMRRVADKATGKG
jgi:hypothetical protein